MLAEVAIADAPPLDDPSLDVESPPARRPILAAEFERMFAEGILGDSERLELLDGEIVRMSPIGSDHHLLVNRLTRILARATEGDMFAPNGGFRFDDTNELQPDLMVHRDMPTRRGAKLPSGEDVRFVCEVSDTSLSYDLGRKARLYAEAGVGEYWVVDARKDRVLVHRDPSPEGYRSVVEHRAPAILAPVAVPEARVDLEELFR